MAGIVSISIDLTKIDKSKIVEKDGKKWLSLNVNINNEIDNYGNNANITLSQTKEEREAKISKSYLGNGKVVWTDGQISVASNNNTDAGNEKSDDDLPF